VIVEFFCYLSQPNGTSVNFGGLKSHIHKDMACEYVTNGRLEGVLILLLGIHACCLWLLVTIGYGW